MKAPFDNVGWVQSVEGARFVCAAHTTEQKDLEGKWLHDPARVKPRKAGGKPTKPAGDLVKGIAEIQKVRKAHPGLAVTFALTANRETSLDLRVSVEARAHAAGIELDVWPVSRISHFLDTNPTGQIIRRNHLGTPVKLVSREPAGCPQWMIGGDEPRVRVSSATTCRAVDAKHHFIVAHEVANVGSERAQLSSMARATRDAMGKPRLKAVAEHQGRWCYGKTPMRTFLDSLELAKEKLIPH